MKKYERKIIIIISIVLLIILVIIFFESTSFSNVEENDLQIKLIDKNKIVSNIPNTKLDKDVYYESKINNYRKQYNNNDIVALLKIKSIGLESLITRTSDNEYYLYRNIYKEYDDIGVPFVDFRNTNLNDAKQINIYGHNTTNRNIYDRLPFTKLDKFLDNSFVKNNRDIILETDKYRFKYKILSTKVVSREDDDHMNVEYLSDDDWLNHVKKLRKNAKYDSGDIVEKEDDLLVFQSCQFTPLNSYLIITSLKVN